MNFAIPNIPLEEPVVIIALILLILLIGPAFFERLRIPSIVGLLICGALIGPHGIKLLSPNLEFSLLGTMGLQYLMFLAGLEIDLLDFIENKLKSIFVGIASFLVPFAAGFLVFRMILNYDVHAAWLIAAMLSSHTLVSYPLLGKLGIVNKPIVTIIVGATIIADILALVTMELITNFAEAGFNYNELFALLLQFMIFLIVVLFLIPKLSRMFLSRYEGDPGVQYIFVLLMLFLASATAHFLQIEPILGAFFSGLILNRQILRTSALYKRIEFVGNNLFIPFFLISIGILANFRIYINHPAQIGILVILTATAFLGKYLAALLSRFFLRISWAETNLLFGLSTSRAASAIAIILIGFNMGIVPESILNSTVILILFSSIVSSYITQRSGSRFHIGANDTISRDKGYKQRILVPVANPANMAHLLEFSLLIKHNDPEVPVYPLTISTDNRNARREIEDSQDRVSRIIRSLHSETRFEVISRIDTNITNGIVRAADEVMATSLVVGWHMRTTPFSILFGDVLNNLLDKTNRMVIVLKTPSTIRDITRIYLFITDGAQYEQGFVQWLDIMEYLAMHLQIKISLSGGADTINAIRQQYDENSSDKYFEFTKTGGQGPAKGSIRKSTADLLIFVHARRNTISYNRHFEHFMNNHIGRFKTNNVIIIYPEQTS